MAEFVQDLLVTQEWISKGGPAMGAISETDPPVILTAGPICTSAQATSNGELEVQESDEELTPPGDILPNVCWEDQVKYMLEKGPWATMPAVCQGWNFRGGKFPSSCPLIPG